METFTAKAAADISAHQHNIMYLSAEDAVSVASLCTNSAICGVLVNKPESGQHATIAYAGIGRVRAGGAISTNVIITTNGSGRAAACTSGDMGMGRLLEAATADGDVVRALLFTPIRWAGAV